ncbi:MAG: hypothetical protein EOM47_11490 [Bacteroidia bacterium]|jgi:hypothetical protein|nr:hypothetical protein [Paludibacter sp.]MDD3489011.1 hypothetical protein [Paludibacter sp.]NCB69455.1 hypothetical protein [Bacteroidia bacterium]
MLTIAVDFDGTIVTHEYPKIGKEIPFAIDTLKRLQKDFQAILLLWTVREGVELDEAVEFCRARGLEFYAVNANYPETNEREDQPRKLKADLFIDDRNLGGLPDWGVIYQMIATGNHLQPIPQNNNDDYQPKKKKGLFGGVFG